MDRRPILVVDDDEEMRKAIEETLHRKGYATVSARNGKEALERIDAGGLRLVVTDVRMPEMDGMAVLREARKRCPRLPFLLVTAFGTVSQAVAAVKEGAVDYLLKPFTADTLLEKVRTAQSEGFAQKEDRELVTQSPVMLETLEMARGVALSDVAVVITGESGTGKELLARYIHKNSPRRTRSLVTVNCASIPDTLLESELFGHEKGAFTGASQRRIGKFETAHESTLLLDEIAEMRTALQAKLLRVLQEKEVERLGSDRPIRVDFRLIATTNRDLQEEVCSGRFREDLYYRINVVPIHLPPLREKKEDIPLLVDHFSREVTERLGMPSKSFSRNALEALQARPWRGRTAGHGEGSDHRNPETDEWQPNPDREDPGDQCANASEQTEGIQRLLEGKNCRLGKSYPLESVSAGPLAPACRGDRDGTEIANCIRWPRKMERILADE